MARTAVGTGAICIPPGSILGFRYPLLRQARTIDIFVQCCLTYPVLGTLEVPVARRIDLDKSKRLCTQRMNDDLSFRYYTLRYCIEEHMTLRVNAFAAIYQCIQLQVGGAIAPASLSARDCETF